MYWHKEMKKMGTCEVCDLKMWPEKMIVTLTEEVLLTSKYEKGDF